MDVPGGADAVKGGNTLNAGCEEELAGDSVEADV